MELLIRWELNTSTGCDRLGWLREILDGACGDGAAPAEELAMGQAWGVVEGI